MLPKLYKSNKRLSVLTLISSEILSLVVSCTPLFKATLAIELFSHNFTIALANPWS